MAWQQQPYGQQPPYAQPSQSGQAYVHPASQGHSWQGPPASQQNVYQPTPQTSSWQAPAQQTAYQAPYQAPYFTPYPPPTPSQPPIAQPQAGYNNLYPTGSSQPGNYVPQQWGPTQAYGAPSVAPQFAVPAPQQTQYPAYSQPLANPSAAPAHHYPSFAAGTSTLGGQVVSRNFLGAVLHPFDNPMLPPHERLPESAIVDNWDGQREVPGAVEALRKATKGLGCDSKTVTQIVLSLTPARMPPLVYAYRARFGVELPQMLEKELRGHLQTLISSYIRGPLGGDIHYLEKATVGLGTKDALLTELVIGRAPLAMEVFKRAYTAKTHKSFDTQVLDELSFKTKEAFRIALMADWRDQANNGKELDSVGPATGGFGGGSLGGFGGSLPINHRMVHEDVDLLSATLHASGGSPDPIVVANIIFTRSPIHLYQLQQAYLAARRAPLTRHIKLNFTGHLKAALLFALEGGKKDVTGAWRDAKQIHATMEGIGTRDNMLIIRIIRAQWDPIHFRTVKDAYNAKYRQPLATRVMKETSGDYRDALMNLVNRVH